MCKILSKNSQPFGKKMSEIPRGDFFDSHCIQERKHFNATPFSSDSAGATHRVASAASCRLQSNSRHLQFDLQASQLPTSRHMSPHSRLSTSA